MFSCCRKVCERLVFERRHGCELYQKLPNSLFIARCSELEPGMAGRLACHAVCAGCRAHSLEEVTELTASCMSPLLFCTWLAFAHEDEWSHLKQQSPSFCGLEENSGEFAYSIHGRCSSSRMCDSFICGQPRRPVQPMDGVLN